nr:immunoglobulin heavy chain junction region [Macaca mulatta]
CSRYEDDYSDYYFDYW